MQDETLEPEFHYIRYMGEITDSVVITQDEDDDPELDEKEPLRIIICMTKTSSWRLAQTQYLQSDIAFKRVTGFLEFEIGGLDPKAKIGTVK